MQQNFLKKYIPINQNWTFLKSSKALKLLKIGPLWRIPLHYLKCENTIGIYWRMKLQFTRPKLNFFWQCILWCRQVAAAMIDLLILTTTTICFGIQFSKNLILLPLSAKMLKICSRFPSKSLDYKTYTQSIDKKKCHKNLVCKAFLLHEYS